MDRRGRRCVGIGPYRWRSDFFKNFLILFSFYFKNIPTYFLFLILWSRKRGWRDKITLSRHMRWRGKMYYIG
jgi:hypothetical protein